MNGIIWTILMLTARRLVHDWIFDSLIDLSSVFNINYSLTYIVSSKLRQLLIFNNLDIPVVFVCGNSIFICFNLIYNSDNYIFILIQFVLR